MPGPDCPLRAHGEAWAKDSKECAFARDIAAAFENLRAAASIPPTELILSPGLTSESGPNASYVPREDWGVLRMTRGMFKCLDGNRKAAAAVLGHEIAHAVQRRLGQTAFAEMHMSFTESTDGVEFYNRRLEAQADRISGQLLVRAGIDATMADFFAQARGCMPKERDIHAQDAHPSDAVRWVEGVRDRERRAQAKAASSAEGARAAARALAGEAVTRQDLAQAAGDESVAAAAAPPAEVRHWTGFVIREGDYKVSKDFDAERIDWYGRDPRASKGLKTDASVPAPFRETPRDGRVRLPDGMVWEIPPRLRHMTPAEIVAFVVRGGTVPDSIAQGFHEALDELRRRGGWTRLPGEVRVARPERVVHAP